MWPGIQNGDQQLIISSFGIMIFIAFLSCNLLMKRTLREKQIDTKIGDDIVFWAAIGGILGAKLEPGIWNNYALLNLLRNPCYR